MHNVQFFIYNLSGCLHCKSGNLSLNTIKRLLTFCLNRLSGTRDHSVRSPVCICHNLIRLSLCLHTGIFNNLNRFLFCTGKS